MLYLIMDENFLKEKYTINLLSMSEIAQLKGCSVHKVEYWMKTFGIRRRSRSDATYAKSNKQGDPFRIIDPITKSDYFLKGMALGLYWGEGNKKNIHSVRLGNTDPRMINMFRKYLIELCSVRPDKIKYSLQVFSDVSPDIALLYWLKELNVGRESFTKTVSVIKSGKVGTYKVKNLYGVCTINVHNKKLRDIIVSELSTPT
jgi:hypothetical protein